MKTVLTIAGSDCSGGAGVQADIKTMTANRVYAMSVITALTAQNTLGVSGIMETKPAFLEKQLDAVLSDIRPDAVKIGMVSSKEQIQVIADKLREYHAENIVVDPVMVSTSGTRLMSEEAVRTLEEELFVMAAVLTPNIPEAEALSGLSVTTAAKMEQAAKWLGDTYGCAVLLKGGHRSGNADDFLYTKGQGIWFRRKRIENPNTHGTGCTMSSAIASNLAKGYSLEKSVRNAKNYITGALNAMLDLGAGNGPLNHAFAVDGEYGEE